MSLRRFLIASSLIVTPVATLNFLAPAAFADTNAQVGVSGNVPSIINIAATATTDATNLPLSTAGQQAVKIADINLTSNNTAGITITASSTNSGALVSSDNASDTIPYQVAVVNAGTTPGSFSDIGNLSQSETSDFDATTGIKAVDLYIQFNQVLPKKGNYADTLTINVADN